MFIPPPPFLPSLPPSFPPPTFPSFLQVEGRKQQYAEDFPFNDAWLDRVVAQKMLLRETLDLTGDSEFIKTRLPPKKKVEAVVGGEGKKEREE